MQYSPKLKTAAEEIKAILAKHDIAGSIVLHTPGFTEYIFHLTPNYSCVFMDGPFVRFRAALSDFKEDEEAQGKAIRNTVNMISSLCETSAHLSLSLIQISEMVQAEFHTTKIRDDHSSHSQQNN
jgi:hypothetical protein